MALDDFINDNDDNNLKEDPPGEYDSWHEAEPDPDEDWHWQITGNKTTLDNNVFDNDTVFIAKDVDNNSTYIASDMFIKLSEE